MKRIILFAAIGLAVLVAIANAEPCQAEGDGCLVAEQAGTCVYENDCNPVTDSNCRHVCQVSDGERKKRQTKEPKKTKKKAKTRKKVVKRK